MNDTILDQHLNRAQLRCFLETVSHDELTVTGYIGSGFTVITDYVWSVDPMNVAAFKGVWDTQVLVLMWQVPTSAAVEWFDRHDLSHLVDDVRRIGVGEAIVLSRPEVEGAPSCDA